MLFNSVDFAIFLPIVFVLYWFFVERNLNAQNLLLLFASYFFYGYWDYRFLLLLIFSITLDFISAKKIDSAKNDLNRKFWFCLSITINLCLLGFFKYYNFFLSSFSDAVSILGLKLNVVTLKLILPIGISFYTFHELSYLIDVYKRRIKPVNNYIEYSLFVTFFPLLVAGPIERATHLLPQIQKKRKFDYHNAVDGLRQILWGLFKKIVIADNCAQYANAIFNNSSHYSGSDHIMGAIFFAFQIYCDFSGYSDIALGTARLFGIELLKNFSYPYFSRDIAEFWRRWHISLSSWFRDYLYIPLGGSKVKTIIKLRNTFIIFLVSGFWHGANWTFIAWGLLNAIYFIPIMLLKRNRNNLEIVAKGKYFPTINESFGIISTFTLTIFAWIFFRAQNIGEAFKYISEIFTKSLFTAPTIHSIIFVMILFIIVEWLGREEAYPIKNLFFRFPKSIRWAFYFIIILMIFNWQTTQQQFIYFHF